MNISVGDKNIEQGEKSGLSCACSVKQWLLELISNKEADIKTWQVTGLVKGDVMRRTSVLEECGVEMLGKLRHFTVM